MRRRISRSEWLSLAPMFALGLAAGMSTAWLETHHGGAEGGEWELSPLERALVAGRALWFHAAKLALPLRLTFIYPRWEVDQGDGWQYVFPVGAVLVILLLWTLRKSLRRGPLAGALFLCGVLFPALGFFDIYPFRFSYVADHFQCHASMGLIALAASTTGYLCSKLSWIPAPAMKRIVAVPTLLFLGLTTAAQSRTYLDLETLWRATLEENPQGCLAHNSLANWLSRQGRFEEAIAHHRQALKLRPDREVSLDNLGLLMMQAGRKEDGLAHLRAAVRNRPDLLEARMALGRVLASKGDLGEAAEHFAAALSIRPDLGEAHFPLGLALGLDGRFREAVKHLAEAVRLNPDLGEARMRLIQTL